MGKNIGLSELSMKLKKIIDNEMPYLLQQITDGYFPEEIIENIMVSTFVKDLSKVLWKSTKSKFTKLYKKELLRIVNDKLLNDRQLGQLTKLSLCIRYEDNILRNPDDSYMSQKDIIEFLDTSKTRVYELLKVLKANQLIYDSPNPKNKNYSIYYLTPELFYEGAVIHKSIKDSLLKLSEHVKNELKFNNATTVDEKVIILDDVFVRVLTDNFIQGIIGKVA